MSTHLANVLSNASNIECFSLAIAELDFTHCKCNIYV